MKVTKCHMQCTASEDRRLRLTGACSGKLHTYTHAVRSYRALRHRRGLRSLQQLQPELRLELGRMAQRAAAQYSCSWRAAWVIVVVARVCTYVYAVRYGRC